MNGIDTFKSVTKISKFFKSRQFSEYFKLYKMIFIHAKMCRKILNRKNGIKIFETIQIYEEKSEKKLFVYVNLVLRKKNMKVDSFAT